MSNAAPLHRVDGGVLEGLVVRAEAALEDAVGPALEGAPGHLAAAIRHAVFAGGSRLRPTLCLAVAAAYGDPAPALANAAAVSIELLHGASLVHDDLPCFDDARWRRGQLTVHAAYGVPTAVLAGDALIVLAFELLARSGERDRIAILAEASGAARGLIAGQAWETEGGVPLDDYHRAKTGSLFRAAAVLGALSAGAGASADAWARWGDLVGRAYQAADDLVDVVSSASASGKVGGRDQALGRPSAVHRYGVAGAKRSLARLVHDAASAVPPCPADSAIHAWLEGLMAKMAAVGALPGRP
jgi:geranylgeranyl diphosphate synthase type II